MLRLREVRDRSAASRRLAPRQDQRSVQNRRRAKELIDHAQRLAAQQFTVRLISQNRPLELTTLTPDQLLDLLTNEHPAS
jgi:hypothetical protein